MGFFWKTTREKREHILELYREGVPVKEIARQAGISNSYVTLLASRSGLPLRNPWKSRGYSRSSTFAGSGF